ncbi:hypothetical protein AB0P36_31960 [Streptomyces flavidovirens]|uniref:hypothetical protein n=1 Tax=Streptomyces flavidovirens TaxID=67298 RepID=UPI003432279E
MHGEHGAIGLAAQADCAAEVVDSCGSLVIVAVDDDDPEFSKAIEEQLSVVTAWWREGPPGEGFEQTVLRSPAERHDVEGFLHYSGIREADEHAVLVVYITSHGAVGRSGRHFLLLPDTDLDRLPATGMPTNEIVIAALDSRARHVLVIVNACEAEGIDVELRAFVRDLAQVRTAGGTLNVVATTQARSPVLGREFAVLLRMAFEWLQDAAGITQPYLSISEFFQALEGAAERLEADRALSVPGPRLVVQSRLTVPLPTLPNPGYRRKPVVVLQAREEVAATHEELEYWLDRASGRASSDDPGWYFSGRQDLNRQLAKFVEGPAGVLVVTGTAASGKSAVLARAVTLSDPSFRASPRYAEAVSMSPKDSVPQEGSVHVAVSARNRGPLSLVEAIGTKLGCEPDRSQSGADELRQWQEGLRSFFQSEEGETVTVVVDGLDESPDPGACLRDVLAPMAANAAGLTTASSLPIPEQGGCSATGSALPPAGLRGLRLLVGVRSSRPGSPERGVGPSLGELLHDLRNFFPAAQVVRTDGQRVREDVTAYVTALLAGAPWGADPAMVTRAAATVASHVGHSFLDARLAAEQLRRSEDVALLSDPQWLSQLDRGTVGLFEEDLDQVSDEGLSRDEALALLRAAAFGLGRGIPWAHVWPAVAQGLLQAPIEHADDKIRRLLGSRLAGYLTHDSEDDRVVYRPTHEQLGAILRQWPQTPQQVGRRDG